MRGVRIFLPRKICGTTKVLARATSNDTIDGRKLTPMSRSTGVESNQNRETASTKAEDDEMWWYGDVVHSHCDCCFVLSGATVDDHLQALLCKNSEEVRGRAEYKRAQALCSVSNQSAELGEPRVPPPKTLSTRDQCMQLSKFVTSPSL